EYQMQLSEEREGKNDVLVIGEKSINGLNYRFARCCGPIYGDSIFGFISSDGTVKIHRTDCPNAANIRERYPYRIIRADWSGKDGEMLPVSLRIIGNDDIGILANITSIISKEMGVNLRNVSVDSNDGMFQGLLVVAVSDQRQLSTLLKKLKTVKGVKDIQRI
ncbi:MAG: RelA/SpoT family protein, partial [Muribaculaceae bacterium]|nr:RelA/SpoT family protein [Muribaculaceae bacterium]